MNGTGQPAVQRTGRSALDPGRPLCVIERPRVRRSPSQSQAGVIRHFQVCLQETKCARAQAPAVLDYSRALSQGESRRGTISRAPSCFVGRNVEKRTQATNVIGPAATRGGRGLLFDPGLIM